MADIRDEFDMFSDLKKYHVGKEVNIKNTVIEHLEKLPKKIEQYYGDTVKPNNDHDWMINPFVAADLPERPLRVAEEFTDMIAEPLNRIIFNSFKSKHPKSVSKFFLLGFNAINLFNRISVCDQTVNPICNYVALRSSI